MKRTSATSRQEMGGGGAHREMGSTPDINVHQTERVASALLGGALVTMGLRRRSMGGAAMAALGANLLYRGVRGRCQIYRALGVNTAKGMATEEPEVERSITIGKPAEELYRLWRAPGNLSRIMAHFAEISAGDGDLQHWKVRGPLGRTVAWNSRVVEERPNEFLRWESLEGSTLPNEGSVRFQPAQRDLGTEVTLRFRFRPPGGAVGNAAARLLGAVPGVIASKALRRFKSLAETGEIPTLERNPSGRATAKPA